MAPYPWVQYEPSTMPWCGPVVVVVVVVGCCHDDFLLLLFLYLSKVRILEKVGFESMKWTESKAKACQNLSNLTNLTQR